MTREQKPWLAFIESIHEFIELIHSESIHTCIREQHPHAYIVPILIAVTPEGDFVATATDPPGEARIAKIVWADGTESICERGLDEV